MAEQFILPNATSKVIKRFLQAVKCTVTTLAHANVGWNATSRGAYSAMMGTGGTALVGRTSLPPHFYLEIPAQTVVPSNSETDVVRMLSRGAVPTVLKSLDKASEVFWNEGRNYEALNSELKKGNVSICIYHLDGVEVTQTERDKVNGFPKKS